MSQNLLSIMQNGLPSSKKRSANPKNGSLSLKNRLLNMKNGLSNLQNRLLIPFKQRIIAACGDNHRRLENTFNLQNQCNKSLTAQLHSGSYRTEQCYLAAMCSKFDIYRFAFFVVAKFPYAVGNVNLLKKITISFLLDFPVLKIQYILEKFNLGKTPKTAVQAVLRDVVLPVTVSGIKFF